MSREIRNHLILFNLVTAGIWGAVIALSTSASTEIRVLQYAAFAGYLLAALIFMVINRLTDK